MSNLLDKAMKDPNNPEKVSSKRLIGIIITTLGGGFLLSVGISSIFKVIADPETALTVGKTLLGGGLAILGVGVLDGVGKAINSRVNNTSTTATEVQIDGNTTTTDGQGN